MNDLEKFIDIRESFSKKLEPAAINSEKTCWDFFINSNSETQQKYEKAEDELYALYKDEEIYNNLKAINKDNLPKHEAKQLKDLLRAFDEELNSGELKKALRKKEADIGQKYNTYIPMIGGKEITKVDITKILQTEPNPDIRKQAYDAKIKGGDLIAEDLIELVKMRNEYSKTKGYDSYFDYMIKEEYDVEPEILDKLINDVYSKAKNKIKILQEKRQRELKEFFKVDELKAYHYGLLLDSNPEKGVNEVLQGCEQASPVVGKGVNKVLQGCEQASPVVEKGVNKVLQCYYSSPTGREAAVGAERHTDAGGGSVQIVERLAKQTYAGMGYDIDKLQEEGKVILDLYPRKGKNTHGFCFGVEAGKDSRILANLMNNVQSLDTLNHELGHCMYDLGLSLDLPFIERQPASSAVTEAVAMMMGDIMKKEDVLKGIVPEELLEKFKESLKEDDARFVSRSLQIIDFERELYKNPNQNPAELWSNIKKKYYDREEVWDNEWATIPHYLTHPGYYQNYFRATLMKAQIYNYLHKVLGNITENKNTAEYMDKNIFALGASIDEYELIKQLTGKEFGVDDFVNGL